MTLLEQTNPKPLRVGMFGGAFDPPHLAHRNLAMAAVQQLGLDVLHIVPTGQAWHKSRPLTPAHHRYAMCQLAFAGLPQVQLDDREILRSGPTYTIDTLTALSQIYSGAQLFLLLGADQVAALETWHRWPDIANLATLVFAQRELPQSDAKTGSVPVPPNLQWGGTAPIELNFPLQNISATAIRAQVLAAADCSPRLNLLVSDGVARYISEHHLYKTHA
ncbi:MAG: hypothetical protein RL323_364 [Pseudomonadota bacterium]